MTVARLRREMSGAEYQQWMALYILDAEERKAAK